jgi:hypothetical protein
VNAAQGPVQLPRQVDESDGYTELDNQDSERLRSSHWIGHTSHALKTNRNTSNAKNWRVQSFSVHDFGLILDLIVSGHSIRNNTFAIVQSLAVAVPTMLFQPLNDLIFIHCVSANVLASEAKRIVAVSLRELCVEEIKQPFQYENRSWKAILFLAKTPSGRGIE